MRFSQKVFRKNRYLEFFEKMLMLKDTIRRKCQLVNEKVDKFLLYERFFDF
jgi:hypothetical protein